MCPSSKFPKHSLSHRKNCTRETFQRDEMTQKKSEVLQHSKASSPDANCASDAWQKLIDCVCVFFPKRGKNLSLVVINFKVDWKSKRNIELTNTSEIRIYYFCASEILLKTLLILKILFNCFQEKCFEYFPTPILCSKIRKIKSIFLDYSWKEF